MSNRYTLIAFTSYWGSKFGGINAFNSDFLEAFGAAYERKVDVVCIVLEAKADDIEDAKQKNVTLIPLPYKPSEPHLGREHAVSAIEEIAKKEISFEPDKTIWLGHDRISGEAAVEARKAVGRRSALIHHMSYDHYEAFAENAQSANKKRSQQKSLFDKADILMAVGPLLRDALEDMIDQDVNINMIIPGLADIEPRQKTPNTFSMFVSGRLSDDALKVKQGQLAIAAFAKSYNQAKQDEQPETLLKRPKLLLRGVDFESEEAQNLHFTSSEESLKTFAAEYAGGAVINLQALPYITDRTQLFNDLKIASVAAMPSWHEGFGLVAWEAIAAGVPLILSKDSGVYELIKEKHPGFEEGHVWVVDISGQIGEPYFSIADLDTVSLAIRKIAIDPKTSREKAIRLREELAVYTWAACAKQVARFFDWDIQKGVINDSQIENIGSSVDDSRLPASNNTPYVEQCGLFMPKPSWNLNQGMAVSVLLRASEALVPFDNYRKPELDKLQTWAIDTSYPISIRLLKGEGGAGKTRLAIELCHVLKGSGWNAGFLPKDLKVDEVLKIRDALLIDANPSLIVIDYAETRTDDLLALIKLLSDSEKQKTGILLLARDGGEWWDNLPAQNSDTEALLSGYATTGPYALSPLYKTLEQRQQGYQNASKAFSQALNIEVSELIPGLTGEHFVNPLFIQMSALLTLHGERPKSADGIIRAILNHEQRYWKAALKNISFYILDPTVRKLLALVTLTGNFATAKEAENYWKSVDDLDMSATDFSRFFNCLSPLYPGYQGLQAVKPDLLGEALVADVLLKSAGSVILSTVLSKSATNEIKQNALTLLARLSLYKPALNPIIESALVQCLPFIVNEIVAVSRETKSHLPELTVAAIGKLRPNVKNSVAAQLSQLINYDSVALNILSCEVNRLIYQKEKLKAGKKPNVMAGQAKYFSALYDYSLSLCYIGQLEEACSKARQAVEISCYLAKQDIDRYQPDYAMSLNNYASILSDLGQNKQAIEYGQKSLDIYQRLAERTPDRYEPAYAVSLGNYANRLGNLGQNEQAIEFDRKSLDIRERLVEQNPDRFNPDYAMSLGNYGVHLSDLGQNEQAIEFAKKSLDIYKRLAEQNLDRYESDYAMSLGNYAGRLYDLSRYDEAIECAKKSLDIRERLVVQNPDRYNSDYAMSLANYGSHLSDLGQYKQAIEYTKMALDIYKRLAEQNPERYEPAYAASLGNYANRLSDLGQNEQAIEFVKKSLGICECLAEQNPDCFEPDYAMSLNNYANCLSGLGQYDKAIEKQIRAINILGCFYRKLPRKYAFELASLTLQYQLLIWLAGKKQELLSADINEDFQQYLMLHESTIFELTQIFIKGVIENNSNDRKTAFNKILQTYPEISPYGRRQLEEYWHCAAVWLYCDDIQGEQIELWLVEWQAFKKCRGGNVPKWMLRYAKNVEIEWP